MSLDVNLLHKNPFGKSSLRDTDTLFGRDKDLKSLLALIRQNRFVILTGHKGCGKTSFLRAGIIPHLRKYGFNAQAGKYWKIAYFSPGSSLFEEFASALALPDVLLFPGQRITPEYVDHMEDSLKADVLGLTRTYEEHAFIKDYNLLIIVDNVEHMFSMDIQDAVKWHFFQSLIYASIYSAHPIYVILSLDANYKTQLFDFFMAMSKAGPMPQLTVNTDSNVNGLSKSPEKWLQNNMFPLFSFNQHELCNILKDSVRKVERDINFNIEIDHQLTELVAERCYEHPGQLKELQNLMSQVWMLWAQDQMKAGKLAPLESRYFFNATGKKESKPGKIKLGTDSAKGKEAEPVKPATKAAPVSDENDQTFISIFNSLGSRDKDVLRYTLRMLLTFNEEQNVIPRTLKADAVIKANPFRDEDASSMLEMLMEEGFIAGSGSLKRNAELTLERLDEFKGNSHVLKWLEEEEMLVSLYRNFCLEAIFWHDDPAYSPHIDDDELEFFNKHLESKIINKEWSKLYNDDFDKLMTLLDAMSSDQLKKPGRQSAEEEPHEDRPEQEATFVKHDKAAAGSDKKKLVIKRK